MDIPTTPTISDLWPQVPAVTGTRPQGGRLTLEIPGLTESPLLTALARSVHLEMRAAGEWAARVDEPKDKGLFPGPRAFARLRADNAARLLAIYIALHRGGHYIHASDLTPEALKASATRSYEIALRDGQKQSQSKGQPPVSS